MKSCAVLSFRKSCTVLSFGSNCTLLSVSSSMIIDPVTVWCNWKACCHFNGMSCNGFLGECLGLWKCLELQWWKPWILVISDGIGFIAYRLHQIYYYILVEFVHYCVIGMQHLVDFLMYTSLYISHWCVVLFQILNYCAAVQWYKLMSIQLIYWRRMVAFITLVSVIVLHITIVASWEAANFSAEWWMGCLYR